MPDVFFLLAFARLEQECQDFLSPCDGMVTNVDTIQFSVVYARYKLLSTRSYNTTFYFGII